MKQKKKKNERKKNEEMKDIWEAVELSLNSADALKSIN